MVKKVFIIVFFVFVHTSFVFGQIRTSDTISNDEVIMVISEAPYYKNKKSVKADIDSLKIFIARNLKYPESALQDKIEGVVFVRFWIDTNGQTTEHHIVRGVREDLDEEALRIAQLINYTEPAKQNGKPVKISYILSIKFENVNCYNDKSYNEQKKSNKHKHGKN